MFIVQTCNAMGDWDTIPCINRTEAATTYPDARNDPENVMVALEDDKGRRFATATRDVPGVEMWN
jgi:hypothetical protein